MPTPLVATLSTNIRQGVVVPPFLNGLISDNSQQAFQVGGIPVSLGSPITYNARYQYSIINSCPDVINLTTVNTTTGITLNATLNDLGICVLIITKLVGGIYELVTTQLTLELSFSHNFIIPLSLDSNYRIITLSGYTPVPDQVTPVVVFGCSPEIVDLVTTVNGNSINIQSTLSGSGTCVAIAVKTNTQEIVSSVYSNIAAASHTLNFTLINGSYRIYVFAVGVILQDT